MSISTNRREHATFADFLRDCVGENLRTPYRRISRGEDFRFLGSRSFEEAMRIAREGWPEGLAIVEKYRAQFSAIIGEKIHRPKLVRSMAGFAPDVGAFLMGEPECMFARETEEINAPGKILRLVVGGVVSGGISCDSIIRRGAMVCALVDALEGAGYSCSVTVAYVSGRDKAIRAEDFVPAKLAGEPLEMDRLAFIVAHPSMYRRLVWSMEEQNAAWFSRNSGSYGSVEQAEGEDRGDIYFDDMFLGYVTNETVVQWMKSTLAPKGITFDE